jgi:hypothetical protein
VVGLYGWTMVRPPKWLKPVRAVLFAVAPMSLSGTIGGLVGLWRGKHGFGWSNLESGWPLVLAIVAAVSLFLFVWREVANEIERQSEKAEVAEDRRILRSLDTRTQTASGIAATAPTEYLNPGTMGASGGAISAFTAIMGNPVIKAFTQIPPPEEEKGEKSGA